ncbi:MAG: ATP-binding protein [Jaaginema sp. PMC 1080.18]|nr:ATP-binding protein [Jaaginema sp. PMC 1080.18]MEC4865666.1 ATP-binding protein [Jaaginema sp. PMC 1078.18]
MILPLVCGIATAVIFTGWLSLQHSQQMMTKAIAHLSQDMGDRLEQRLEIYLDLPYRANQVTLNVLKQQENFWNAADLSIMQQHFARQISDVFPELMFLGGGGEQGEFTGVYRRLDGSLQAQRLDSATQWVNRTTTLDAEGKESAVLGTDTESDPRKRPWYRQAIAQKRSVWSSLAENDNQTSPRIVSAATPFWDTAGQLMGVLVADVSLKAVSAWLNQLWFDAEHQWHGHLFLFDRQGNAIAQSQSFPNAGETAVDWSLFEGEIELLQQKYDSLDALQTPQQLFWQYQGRGYLVGVTPIQNSHGLDWLLALTLPPEDLGAYLPNNTQDIFLLCGLTLILGSSIAAIVSRAIITPIQRLSQVSQAIAQGSWHQPPYPSRIRELDAVAQSFAQMMQQLQQSQDTLEANILQRTEQLQQEIRDRQATEAQLREKQRALAMLMSNLPGMAYRNLYDEHWTMEVVSEGCTELTGYTPQSLLGNHRISFENLTHPDDRAWVRRDISAAVERREPFQLVYRIVTVSGQAKWIWEKGQGIFNEAGEAIALEGFMTDIDERKRTEDALRDSQMKLKQAKEAAEQANQAKSSFLAQMSHELRTPLNGILGYTQILRRSPQGTLTEHQGLAVIYQCGTYLLTLINDILTLAKLDACKLELNPESCDLHQILRDIINLCILKAQEKGIELMSDLDANLPRLVQIDRKRLQQVLLNLLENAVKFTHSGQVTLRVQCLTCDPQELQQHLRFQVEDTGKGLTSQELTKIFLPFEQGSDRQDRDLGFGLGLEIAQQLVQLMGGELSASSIPHQGSIFSFDLNVTRSQQPPVNRGDRLHLEYKLQGRKRKILIIDRDRSQQLQISNWLQLLGFTLEVARDSRESQQQIEQFQPDLILWDATLLSEYVSEQAESLSNTVGLVILVMGQGLPQCPHFPVGKAATLTVDFLNQPLQFPKLLHKIQECLQLTWVESSTQNAIAPQNVVGLPADFPDLPHPEILQQWLKLAKRGRLLDLEKEVRFLQQNQPRYAAFTESFLDWCQNFQLSTIKQFLYNVLAPDSDCG